jgi:hypothetical protein
MNRNNRINNLAGAGRRYIILNNIYLNVNLIAHHEAVEGNPRHSKVTFNANVNGQPLEIEVNMSEKELTHLIENAKEYECNST